MEEHTQLEVFILYVALLDGKTSNPTEIDVHTMSEQYGTEK